TGVSRYLFSDNKYRATLGFNNPTQKLNLSHAIALWITGCGRWLSFSCMCSLVRMNKYIYIQKMVDGIRVERSQGDQSSHGCCARVLPTMPANM
ncbi:unnamed protein product, partial [Ectocarpus sp. 8 AP-2014]